MKLGKKNSGCTRPTLFVRRGGGGGALGMCELKKSSTNTKVSQEPRVMSMIVDLCLVSD